MEDAPSMPENEQAPDAGKCIGCGSSDILHGYPNPLCQSCRDKHIKFPIPLWIKLFAGGIGILVLFSLFSMRKDMVAGVGLEKAKKAELHLDYLTAEHELERLAARTPDDMEVEYYLLKAYLYNGHYTQFFAKAKQLSDKPVDESTNEKLLKLADQFKMYCPSNDLSAFVENYGSVEIIPDTAWGRYFADKPGDVYGKIMYGEVMYERGEYRHCDSLMQDILSSHPEHLLALALDSRVLRRLGSLDSSMDCAERILEVNRQSVYGNVCKIWTLLAQKKDEDALKLAKETYDLDKEDIEPASTLILAYHFNKMNAQRDAMIKKGKDIVAADSSGRQTLTYVCDVVSGKEKFRD